MYTSKSYAFFQNLGGAAEKLGQEMRDGGSIEYTFEHEHAIDQVIGFFHCLATHEVVYNQRLIRCSHSQKIVRRQSMA